jgi:hypothetical protein
MTSLWVRARPMSSTVSGLGRSAPSSQVPLNTWHHYLDDPTLADTVLDRFIHNAPPVGA